MIRCARCDVHSTAAQISRGHRCAESSRPELRGVASGGGAEARTGGAGARRASGKDHFHGIRDRAATRRDVERSRLEGRSLNLSPPSSGLVACEISPECRRGYISGPHCMGCCRWSARTCPDPNHQVLGEEGPPTPAGPGRLRHGSNQIPALRATSERGSRRRRHITDAVAAHHRKQPARGHADVDRPRPGGGRAQYRARNVDEGVGIG